MASRPPRKCRMLGDGMVSLGVTLVTDFTNLKWSTKIGFGRASLPTTASAEGVRSISPLWV